jgi:hypothetical protein
MSRQLSHLIPLAAPLPGITHVQMTVYHSPGSYTLSLVPADRKPNGIVTLLVTQGARATLEHSKRFSEKRLGELFHHVMENQIEPRNGLAWSLAFEVARKAGGSL